MSITAKKQALVDSIQVHYEAIGAPKMAELSGIPRNTLYTIAARGFDKCRLETLAALEAGIELWHDEVDELREMWGRS